MRRRRSRGARSRADRRRRRAQASERRWRDYQDDAVPAVEEQKTEVDVAGEGIQDDVAGEGIQDGVDHQERAEHFRTLRARLASIDEQHPPVHDADPDFDEDGYDLEDEWPRDR